MDEADITLRHGLVVWILGFLFFTSVFIALKQLLLSLKNSDGENSGQPWPLMRKFSRLSEAGVYKVTISLVSSLQAILSCIVGFIIVMSCQKKIMTDRHWLTNWWGWFCVPYFLYDTLAMYAEFLCDYKDILRRPKMERYYTFLMHNKLMMVHHFVLPLVLVPCILFFRNGKGDFFVGTFYMIEMAIPFIAFRHILCELELKHRPIYIVAGLAMIAAFGVSRLLVFPYLYWKYALSISTSVWDVPYTIPIKCNLCCLLILLPQVYWFCIMVRGAFQVFYKIYKKNKKHY